MISQTPLCLCSALFVLFISSSLAYNNLYVGGKDGWVINPSESYNHWAKRTRFQVNDTLVFKYKEGSDSVSQVSKEDYSSCNNKKPIRRMTSGESVFQLDRSGSFYFISGKEVHCHKGQKLNVVVLAVRPSPVSPTTPPPASQPPSAMPPKAPSPAPSAQSPAPWSRPPSPHARTPTVSPTPQPAYTISPSPEEHNAPSPSPNGKDADIATPPSPSDSWVPTPSCLSTLLAVTLISLVMGVSPWKENE